MPVRLSDNVGSTLMGRGVAALLFHHVGPNRAGTPPSLTVRPERFRRFLRYLVRSRYQTMRAGDCIGWLGTAGRAPARTVLLTFDDAFADLCEHALPSIRALGMSATVFVA